MENRLTIAAPVTVPVEPDPRFRHIGMLIHKSYCYALRRRDGSEIWLEMDRIPHHLIEQIVLVEGAIFGNEVISVERIGPYGG